MSLGPRTHAHTHTYSPKTLEAGRNTGGN